MKRGPKRFKRQRESGHEVDHPAGEVGARGKTVRLTELRAEQCEEDVGDGLQELFMKGVCSYQATLLGCRMKKSGFASYMSNTEICVKQRAENSEKCVSTELKIRAKCVRIYAELIRMVMCVGTERNE